MLWFQALWGYPLVGRERDILGNKRLDEWSLKTNFYAYLHGLLSRRVAARCELIIVPRVPVFLTNSSCSVLYYCHYQLLV